MTTTTALTRADAHHNLLSTAGDTLTALRELHTPLPAVLAGQGPCCCRECGHFGPAPVCATVAAVEALTSVVQESPTG